MAPQPGDLVLAHSKGAFATLIRFGQWLRPKWRPYRTWNHCAIVTSVTNNEVWVTQMGRKCETVRLEQVSPGGFTTIRKMPAHLDRVRVVEYAMSQLGVRYSVAAIFSIALSLLTPRWVRFDFRRHGDALICSALVARAYEHGGWMAPTDPFQITPAEMAQAISK